MRVLLDFESAHSFTLKCNVVLSQLIRIYRLHSDLSKAGEAMYLFIQLMVNFRHLTRQTARKIWRKFLNWLTKQCGALVASELVPCQPNVSFYLPNNCILDPIKRVVREFVQSLEEKDRLKVSVKERAGRAMGRSLFVV